MKAPVVSHTSSGTEASSHAAPRLHGGPGWLKELPAGATGGWPAPIASSLVLKRNERGSPSRSQAVMGTRHRASFPQEYTGGTQTSGAALLVARSMPVASVVASPGLLTCSSGG